MCRRVECPKCGRPTFAGCGAHVEEVLGDVPRTQRCQCREGKSTHTEPTTTNESRSWFRNLFAK